MVQPSKDGKAIAEISNITHKPWSTCKDILKNFWDTGNTKNNRINTKRSKYTEMDDRSLTRIIKRDPTATTKSIIAEFQK